jgi:hypothetical protein
LADQEIVKEHFDGSQVLLDRLGRTGMLFNIGGHVHRGDQPQIVHVLFALGQKLTARAGVGFARIGVPDPGCEKLEELGRGVFAGVSQNRRNDVRVADG